MTNGRIKEIASWFLLAVHFAVLMFCLVQIRIYNDAMIRIQNNQVLMLKGIVMTADHFQNHDTWSKQTAQELFEWKSQVDSVLAARGDTLK